MKYEFVVVKDVKGRFGEPNNFIVKKLIVGVVKIPRHFKIHSRYENKEEAEDKVKELNS